MCHYQLRVECCGHPQLHGVHEVNDDDLPYNYICTHDFQAISNVLQRELHLLLLVRMFMVGFVVGFENWHCKIRFALIVGLKPRHRELQARQECARR